ncbi:uncharacterized protein MONOS_3429 [Monocercomonoides exilis]|uniref:uncharacterized protein n=1 Tax=Monocercomonoides exilis TaxID=2049356 RepID=UPI00355A15A8|nr:hypothetical protein MONOS_3429 [Monocercomonoides exilis]|eukprot:MONOS_3429.1-p1 / transcript=MONOS_3429.1 / gene=MONOS_3429 / organism=Monocercomonoides_exilis_PA203 / gene_product=unspecified product / transcript_product=unspecified product / location=Mono_scaffold00080:137677-138018(+) / protein_length=114 / sequence_SO=supercontig / SO=protein_coding / is_pseudo=false
MMHFSAFIPIIWLLSNSEYLSAEGEAENQKEGIGTQPLVEDAVVAVVESKVDLMMMMCFSKTLLQKELYGIFKEQLKKKKKTKEKQTERMRKTGMTIADSFVLRQQNFLEAKP